MSERGPKASSQVAPQLAAVDALDRDPEDFEHFTKAAALVVVPTHTSCAFAMACSRASWGQVAFPPSPRMIARSGRRLCRHSAPPFYPAGHGRLNLGALINGLDTAALFAPE